MSWLFALLSGLFSAFLSWKEGLSVRLGKNEQKFNDLQENVNTLNAESKAAADSPTNMEQLIAEQRKGDV